MPATSASVVLHPVVQFPLKELKTHSEIEIINNCDQQSNETLPHSLSSSSFTSCSSSGSHRSYTCLKSTSEESLLSPGMNSSSSTASYFSMLSLSPHSPPHSPCRRPSTPTVPLQLANLQPRLLETQTRIAELHKRCTDRIAYLNDEAFRNTQNLHQTSWRCLNCTLSRQA